MVVATVELTRWLEAELRQGARLIAGSTGLGADRRVDERFPADTAWCAPVRAPVRRLSTVQEFWRLSGVGVNRERAHDLPQFPLPVLGCG